MQMRYTTSILAAVTFTSVLTLAACERGDAATAQVSAAQAQATVEAPANSQPDLARMHSDAPGIAWFKGDVDASFKSAQASHKPVLLYWGAQWCPPCKQLKSAVFSRPDFIEKSKLFVAVYLDGDLPDAQKWGDVFRVTGYPTVVVLKPGSNRDHARREHGSDPVCARLTTRPRRCIATAVTGGRPTATRCSSPGSTIPPSRAQRASASAQPTYARCVRKCRAAVSCRSRQGTGAASYPGRL
jgi:thiol-disulfide isomerase/thioredoxin